MVSVPSRPEPPCPVFDGRQVLWRPWQWSPLMTHMRQACETCKDPVPDLFAHGLAVFDEQSWPVVAVGAYLCSRCSAQEIVDLRAIGAGKMATLPSILCDQCDVLAAAGATLAEARASLLDLGGWTGGADTDWDLCRACNPVGPVVKSLAHARLAREARGVT